MIVIAFEGGDRAGKSTQCQMLLERLAKQPGLRVSHRRYPNRQHPHLGPLINDYLAQRINLPDTAASLLLAASLFEEAFEIDDQEIYLYDRYKASCTAYAVARGMPHEQAALLTKSKPDPHLTIYLRLPVEQASARAGFGQERFDRQDFQAKVVSTLDRLADSSSWMTVDASLPVEQIAILIWNRVSELIKS